MKIKSIAKFILLSLLLVSLAVAFCSCSDIFGQGGSGNNGGDNGGGDAGDNGGGNTGDNSGNNGSGSTDNDDGDNTGNNTGDNTGNNSGNGSTDNNGDNTDDPDGDHSDEDVYTVSVVDADGKAETKIIVYLYEGDSQVKFAPLTAGKATFSTITSGEYRIVLKDMTNKRSFVYDETVVNEENRNVTITVYNKLLTPTENIYFLSADIDDAIGFAVGEGTYSVDVKGASYFVVRTSKAGMYTITATASEDIVVVNYGNPQIATRIDEGTNELVIEVPPIIDEVTPFVIAFESSKNTNAIVKIERTADLNNPAYLPWTEVQAQSAPSSVYDLPENTELVDIDVFSSDFAVTLGNDGYYYTADGKLVLVKIGAEAPYLGVSLAWLVPGLLESSEAVETFGFYYYDDDGNFLRKENYGPVIKAYYEKCDPELGVVPLTEELVDIIKIIGNARGWWDYDSDTGFYLFGEELVNEDIAWLFACCVAK